MNFKKLKINKKTIILSVTACILLPIIIYSAVLVYKLYFSKMPTFVTSEIDNTSDRPTDLPTSEESGIDNIVLFGVDNRTPTDHGRTDSIIIATIDKNSKVIKLTSVMRDLYVEMGNDKSMDKINAAYAYGGPDLALKTLNKNFGLDLKYYAIIDFKAFQELVDKLDGIDVDVKNYEVNEINTYIKEVNWDNPTLLSKGGFQHLNGQQALSFARIRKVGDGDFERTERQRIVLKCLAEKAKNVSIIKIPDLLTTLASYVQTNVPLSKVISLGVTAYKFNGGIEQMRIPVDGYYDDQNVYGAAVLVPDVKVNALYLKEFIYNIKFSGDKDLPVYMYNNFHMEDNDGVGSKPKSNIPDYNTPGYNLKPESEQSDPISVPGKTTETNQGTTPASNQGTNTGTTPGDNSGAAQGDQSGTDTNTGQDTPPGDNTGTNPGVTP